MKKTILCLVLSYLIFVPSGFTQAVKVENVRFEQQGDIVIIHYNLKSPSDKKCIVSVEASKDFGRTFSIKPIAVSGEVGKGVKPGLDRQIRWNLTRDFPSGLEGQGFVFAVDAKLDKGKSKWPWIGLGTGVVGVAAYLILKPPGDDGGNPNGTITLHIPGDF